MPYEIVRYTPELRDQVVALDRHLVSPDPDLNSRYFRWKHEENPYVSGPILFVAMNGDRVVGKRGFLGARWRVGNGGTTAAWLCICDLAVDPEHRGHHLFQKITEVALPALVEEGHQVLLNWSASPISYFGYLKTGWRLVGPYSRLVREAPGARLVRAFQRRARQLPLTWRYADRLGSFRTGFASFDHAWSKAAGRHAIEISTEPDPSAMANLVARNAGSRAGHVRDQTYYGWRFRNPVADYRFMFRRDAELDGFLVLHAGRLNRFADIAIVDWEARSPTVFESLLTQLARTGGYDSLSIWSATLNREEIACLTRLGFRFADDTRGNPDYQPGPFIYVAAGSGIPGAVPPEAPVPESLDGWNLRMAFSDYY